MHRYKHHIPVPVADFHHLADTSLVVVHPHQASEYAYAVVYVHYVVSYVEGVQVVDGQLLALFHAAAYAHAVETLEYLVVGIVRDLGILVHESLVDIHPLHELRQDSSLPAENGAYTVDLGGFVGINPDRVTAFRLAADILFQQIEVLVESRLGAYMELFRIGGFHSHRNLEKNPAESLRLVEEIFFLI